MGADLAPYSAGQARRQQAYSKLARDRQRADVHSEHRLPMAGGSRRHARPRCATLHDYFDLWNWDGTLDRIHHALYVECRERAGREASPTAAIIDSQSVKSAEKGGLTTRMATMRARRSKARSGIFSSIRKAS